MEKSFKKLSMMVMLTCTIGYSLNANTQGGTPYVTTIKVTNMGGNQYIGADDNYTKQKPIDNDNNYKFSSGHSYYLMVYHKANTDCGLYFSEPVDICAAHHSPSQSVRRSGEEFKGSEGGEWNVQTNEITVKKTDYNSLRVAKKAMK